METEDIDKILNKSYSELTVAERETIQEICSSEEEFVQLQQFFTSVENYAQETREDIFPAQETKEKLDVLFHETYQNKGILWYNAVWTVLYPTDKRFDQRPLVRIAAVLVLLISLVPLFNKPVTETKVLAHNENTVKEEPKDSAKDQLITEEIPQAETRVVPVQPLEENHISQIPAAPLQYDMDVKRSFKSVANASTDAPGENVTYSWSTPAKQDFKHSDGIYMDTLPKRRFEGKYLGTSQGSVSNVNQNLAMLDLLTPAF